MNIFSMHRGDDKHYEITVIDRKTRLPVDITGCTLKMTWRATFKGPIQLQKDFTLTDPVNGVAEVMIAHADTANWENAVQEYYFDVQITKTTAEVETLTKGKFVIEPEVTY